MKGIVKKIIIIIFVVGVIYVLFCVEECFRFKHEIAFAKPLITLDEEFDGDTIRYSGLGYSVEYTSYYKTIEKNGKEIDVPTGSESKFKLFGIEIMSWSDNGVEM